MTTAQRAWDAFLRAVAETNDLRRRGASWLVIGELLRHARDLLDIIEEEVTASSAAAAGAMRQALVQLRTRLESLKQDVMPTRH